MSTISLDAKSARQRRVLCRAAIIGGVAAAVVMGLLTAESISTTATTPKASANARVSHSEGTSEQASFNFVPSPVIETNAKFFFGSGDGSAGYYGESPTQETSSERAKPSR
jgi:hypothetical protein